MNKSTEVYYFSGTGNSLFAAREIAGKINGKLISIPSIMEQERIITEADVIGIVFPVYYATNDCGIPLIIGRFVKKLENLNSKYMFAVCTHGGAPGTTIENFGKLIESHGGELAAGFTVKMSYSSSAVQKINYTLFRKELETDVLADKEQQQKILDNWKKKLETIYEYVNARKTGKFETRGTLRKIVYAPPLYLLMKPLSSRRYRKLSGLPRHMSFSTLIPLADKSFQTSEKCNGCGICAQVCPVDNIRLVEGRPVWQHHCETCLACYSWCPQAAVGGDIVEYNTRYHHPSIQLSDVMRAKQ